MKNFKIGDKVVLNVPKGEKFKPGYKGFKYGIVPEMEKIVEKNKILTVANIFPNGEGFQIEEDNGVYNWDISWFEKYKVTEVKTETEDNSRKCVNNITIIKNGKETIAIMGEKMGKAKRNSKDTNNDVLGILIAVMRMLEFDKETQKRVIDMLFDSEITLKLSDLWKLVEDSQ